ncbi:hypothetical protein EV189_3411 [Motilibacter rhizosphaerae]|uniref:Ribosomally synthesized peptide with SipW-like signal peptide n=1 Tax=Motilibacter rhizosphaerae TaxID=598652 RepID=A0A4Q7NAH5_9ACTN|nr:hypothetical protein [Motilibacter rhizosphaerae]RZS79932.1 hypothetical protein EV189_3411 [Motilibacter rhizosphaerae]
MTRTATRRGRTIRPLLAAAALLAPVLLAPARADAALPSWASFISRGSRCTADAHGLYHVTSKGYMKAENGAHVNSTARHFVLKIRLEHPSDAGAIQPGAYASRQYPAAGAPALLSSRTYQTLMAVTSSGYDPAQDWTVHVQVVFDRSKPFPDVVRDIRFPLANLSCPPTSSGIGIGSG